MNMKHLYTSLGSGVTSGSVTDNSITDDSVIEVYFDNTDCYIDTTSQSGHTVYFTVGGNTTGTNVCVVVNNLTDFTPYNDADIQERVDELETTIEELETTIDGLNASNISYDEHSTLYSAMGDIDSLETTSKNIVGAINEVKESGGGGGQSYSTTEQVIGTWIDGKPLYRRVKTYSNQAINNTVLLDIDNLEDADIFYIESVFIMDRNAKPYKSILFTSTTATSNSVIGFRLRDDNKVQITGNDSFSASDNRTIFIIYRYTKTTD